MSDELPHTHSFHSVGAEHRNTVWDNSIPPVLEVETGATIELETADASGGQLTKSSTAQDVPKMDMSNVNPVTGPIFVKGAEPGDTLQVEILELAPNHWGWTAIIPGFGLLADEFPDPWLNISQVDAKTNTVRFNDQITLPFAPFPGTIGLAPKEPGAHSVLPPTKWGGNMDIKHLTAGTTLYLPVAAEGALFSVGDTHAAMGDAEVCGTAVESAMTITVRLTTLKNRTIPFPQYRIPAGQLAPAETTGYHVCTGIDSDLTEAAKQATRATIEHIEQTHGIDRQTAYAIASTAVDLRIHELVDAPNWVVGGVPARRDLHGASVIADEPTPADITTGGEAAQPGLRRELKIWEAIALSIGIMAPTAAMALNGTAPASLIGRAVPLAFIFATIGVLFVSYSFIRLSRYFNHAGSSYAFAGMTLGPRAGFLSGWALLGTYWAFTCASTAEAGSFGVSFLSGANIDKHADYVVIALIAGAIIAVLAFGDIRVATRALLTFEGISVTLIIVLMVVIVVKIIGGSAPGGQSINADVFKIPSGTSFSTIATAATFGFLSFAGFEGAASLGEETDNPRIAIPRAIRAAVIGTGIFYILCILVQTWGFGTNAAGVNAFASSTSPLGDLARSYVGSAMEDVINAGATLSAFASALAATAAGGRILYALARDTPAANLLGRTSTRTGAPAGALAVTLIVGMGAVVAQRIAGVSSVNAFFYPGTLGVLSLLVAYIVTNLGAIRYLFIGARRAPLYEIVCPIIGIAFLGYTLYKNVSGVVFPYNRFWIVVAGWLLFGLLIVVASPGMARRIGVALARDEGLEPAE